ncbi:MAG: hypothetical protein JSR67_11155 [Proteobacteria bacterium]|nr:hypothetical protein [Pseudomonadota bacterium]
MGTAITNGLNYLDTNNAFQNPSSAGNAAGLTTLALLEKRASGNPSDPPQGYNGASAADQARLRRSVAYLLSSGYAAAGPFYAYVDGGFLSALSLYTLTGGPDSCGPAPNPRTPCSAYPSTPVELQGLPHSLVDAINNMVDNTLANQRTVANGFPNDTNVGYWCYTNGGCTDSSTTQYAALGLSAAQAVYNNPTFGDPGARLPKMAAALAAAAHVYATDAAQGSQDPGCDPGYKTTPNGGINGVPGDPNAYGHGYHSPSENYPPSLQQTASGAFVQLLGGGNVNTPMVQGYMRWVYDHYRYTDIGGVNGAGNLYNSWPYTYFYYLWSSFKGMEFIAQQGIAPSAGNLGITSYGTLAPASAPACTDRQLHRDPATVQRVPIFGAGGAGFYSAESQTQYFDFAYSILSYQCADGSFFCSAAAQAGGATNPSGQGWARWDTQSYGLLVLQRATGVVLPTATLTTDIANTTVGTTVHLTWGSQNANSCAATGGTAGDGWTGNALAASGMLPVKETVAGTYTYTVTCSAGSQNAQAQVQVTFTKAAILMCDVSGPNGSPDGEVSQYDITAIMHMLGQKVQPAGPAPAAADPMRAGIITAQDVRACSLRCTKTNCAN